MSNGRLIEISSHGTHWAPSKKGPLFLVEFRLFRRMLGMVRDSPSFSKLAGIRLIHPEEMGNSADNIFNTYR